MPIIRPGSSFSIASALATLCFGTVMIAGGCGGHSTAPTAGPPAHFDIAAGNDQSAVVGTELAQALVVKVTDAQGLAVKGTVVNFRVVAGGGSVFAGSGASTDSGFVKERWTLGTVTTDTQRVEARGGDGRTCGASTTSAN